VTIFLTRSRRTQKKIFNDSFTMPEATYSGGDSLPLITDRFAREVQATDEARELGEPLALGEVLVLVSCRTPREL